MTTLVPCTARLCSQISGVGPVTDVTIYSLQDSILFNGVPLSFLVTCPAGYYCPPGSFPRVITYPPGTFVIPQPLTGGFPIVLQLQGCQTLVSRTLAADATADEIQAAANEIILEVGEQQAECDSQPPSGQENPSLITLSEIAAFFCLEEAWDVTITTDAPASAQPLTFLVIGGDLPSGITQSQSTTEFFLTGTAAAMGTYNFTIGVGGVGAYGQQAYSVVVGGITTASPLPDASLETPYSEALAQSGLTGTLTWGAVGGLSELPSWLSLNTATGTLFGTPPADAEGPYTFTITVTNGVNTCEKEFELGIAAACPDWTLIPWDTPFVSALGGATASFTPISSPSDSFESEAIINGIQSAVANNEGTFQYNGAGCNCNLHIEATITGSNLWASFAIFQDGGFVLNEIVSTSGSYDFPFVIADTGGVPQDIRVVVTNSVEWPNGSPASRLITGQVTNV